VLRQYPLHVVDVDLAIEGADDAGLHFAGKPGFSVPPINLANSRSFGLLIILMGEVVWENTGFSSSGLKKHAS
jgi:hypothetical protein